MILFRHTNHGMQELDAPKVGRGPGSAKQDTVKCRKCEEIKRNCLFAGDFPPLSMKKNGNFFQSVSYITEPNMKFRHLLCGILAAIVSLGSIDSVSADIMPTFDARADTAATSGVIDQNANTLLAVGPLSSGRFFRTYFTFDLSEESVAADVTFDLFASGDGFFANNENNTSALSQTFSLFLMESDWNGANISSGGPLGTELAQITVNVPQGDYTQNIAFNSVALTTAFNNAIGGNLYLGLRSLQEGAGVRSFAWLAQTEITAVGVRPVMRVTAVPEPASWFVLGVGSLGMVFRRRR
jgi:hypothetical protein